MKSSSKSYCRSLWTSIATMLLIISAMVPLIAEAEINSTDTYFWVDPPTNIYKAYCNTFSVDIRIQAAPATYAWGLTLEFDNNTLGVMSVVEGPWLNRTTEDTIFIATSGAEANKTGTLGIGCTLTGSVVGTSGSGVLCTIVFHVESCGTSKLDLQDTVLLDVNLVSIEYPNNDGFFACTAVHDIEISSVTANVSGTINQGVPVGVTVTVHNGGNFTEGGSVKVTANPRDAREPVVQIDVVQPFAGLAPGGDEVLIFNWTTTTVAGEVYDIVANATITGTDDDPHDNVYIDDAIRVKCPHDIDITDVEILTPLLHVDGHALVNVTAANEGQNQESFTITIWADNGTYVSNVSTVDVANLAVDGSKTVTATWQPDTAGVYVIKANATLVAVEKDEDDNEKTDGILTVIYDDIILIEILAYPTCSGLHVSVTIKNGGTDWARFTVYVWAVWPNETGSFDPDGTPPTTNALWIGWIPLGSLAPGENYTFTGIDPYGGVPYGTTWKTLYPPYTALTPCQSYYIYAVVKKEVDVDDDTSNNYGTSAPVKARQPGDIDGNGSVGSPDYAKFGAAYGALLGQSNWNLQADINNSGGVGSADYAIFGAYYGKYCICG